MTPESSGRATGRWPLLLIPFAALIAAMPLIQHGCSCGHDFDFHLLSWFEAANQIGHGNLHPHWAFTPAFNAGEPRFIFYPPLSWYLGAILGLILTHLPGTTEAAGWEAAPILFTWIALTASGLTMHRLAREFATPNAALLAAILYLANPYMLFTAYERTAYGELLSAAWIPLLFLSILTPRITIPRIALPIALLWLTNAPAAIMGSYTLLFLTALRLAADWGAPHLASEMWISRHESGLQIAPKILAGTILGHGLAAFYLIPAAYQSRFVQVSLATIGGSSIVQNFLFEHNGTSPDALLHDAVLHTASLIAILILSATAVFLLAVFLRRKMGAPHLASERRMPYQRAPLPLAPLALLTAAIALLLTPWSLPLWDHIPKASLLQFPWRLLAILTPILALAAASALSSASPSAPSVSPSTPSIAALSRWVGRNTFALPLAVLLLAILLAHPAYHVFQQPCDDEDTAPARLALFHSNLGTDPTDEYTPVAADNDALQPNNPPWWLAASPDAPAPQGHASGPAPTRLALTGPRAEFLILNLRNYPAWRITRNGAPYPERYRRDDGLIAMPIPAGPSTLEVRYATPLDQTLGDAVSALALLSLLAITRRPRARSL